MQFRDLGAQYRALKPQIDAAILAAVEEGRYISGPQVGELEERLAAYVGVEHCVTCSQWHRCFAACPHGLGVGREMQCSCRISHSFQVVR